MRIAVCDDEALCRRQLISAVDSVTHSLDIITDGFEDGGEFLRRFSENPYDLVFLDIEMPRMDGITLARKLREISGDVPLVFLTCHIEYALEGYEVNALRYLTKPVNEDKLREVINFVTARLQEGRTLWIKTEVGDERLSLYDILYFEAQNQNVLIHTANKAYSVRYNIGDYEQQLCKDGFFRIHRGYLVSLRKIKSVGKGKITLEGDISLPVSRSKEKELREALFSHVKEASI